MASNPSGVCFKIGLTSGGTAGTQRRRRDRDFRDADSKGCSSQLRSSFSQRMVIIERNCAWSLTVSAFCEVWQGLATAQGRCGRRGREVCGAPANHMSAEPLASGTGSDHKKLVHETYLFEREWDPTLACRRFRCPSARPPAQPFATWPGSQPNRAAHQAHAAPSTS